MRTLPVVWARPVVRTASLGLALFALACEPSDRRPGSWLSGEPTPGPVASWSACDQAPEIFVETRTWYGIPHSVTAVCASQGADLYVPSVYSNGGEFPEERFWNRNVVRDSRVRLKIGEQLYERHANLVTDPEEWRRALDAFAAKYSFWEQLRASPPDQRPELYFLRMDPRSSP